MSPSDPTLLSASVRASVEAELAPGEGVRWVAQPVPWQLARQTWPIVLFAIPWTAFALFWMLRSAKRTVYVVTDRRAIVIRGGWGRSLSVRSFDPEKLSELRRDRNPDGSGSLVFGQDVRETSKGGRSTVDYGFLAVPNVREAEEYVRALAPRAPRV